MIGRIIGSITPLGRGVIGLAVLSLVLARLAGLLELSVVAAMCGLLIVLSLPFVLIPTRVTARLDLRPDRTEVGIPVHGRLQLRNQLRLKVGNPIVLLSSGSATRWARLPTLEGRGSHEETFEIPAPQRGVIEVGPVLYRRSDPIGLFGRHVRWAPSRELLVWPRIIDLEALPLGDVRDLEGVPSDRLSMSDLAFHALREYVPGDDLRHVHWRSSARAGELLVRQYHDTRRARATLLVDTQRSAYVKEADFELALSTAASITTRAVRDAYDLTVVCGDQLAGGGEATPLLDTYCRATFRDLTLNAQLANGLLAAVEASLFFLITGTGRDVGELQSALAQVPGDVWTCVIRVGAAEKAGVGEYAGRPLITLQKLDQLPVAMHEVTR